jgi:hypothetical protein
VRGKVHELTAVTGVAGVGEEKGRSGGSTANRDGRRSSKGRRQCSGGQSAGRSEEVAGKLLHDDVVLVVCLAGLRGSRSSGRR